MPEITDEVLAELEELREVVAGADHTAAKYWRKYGQLRCERDRARDLAVRLEAELAAAQLALDVAEVVYEAKPEGGITYSERSWRS